MGNVIELAGGQNRGGPVRIGAMPAPRRIAVVVPTLNEAGNVAALVAALDAVLGPYESELIFVDDWSSDGTPDIIEQLSEQRPDIRLLRRHNRRGLASAAIEGILATTAPIVAVIDADLQHDETILPAMIDAVAGGLTDVAIGSRYVDNGSCGRWSERRKGLSRLATRLASLAIGSGVADPLSGFFAVRREIVVEAAPRLSSSGFKILLDLLASAHVPLTVREFPYVFRTRVAGDSKLSMSVALDYLRLLIVKSARRLLTHRLVMFGLVGLSGVGVNFVVLSAALGHMSFARAQALGVAAAIACNFLLNNVATFRDRRLRGVRLIGGLASFYLVCGLGALANVGVGAALFASDYRWWVSSLAGALVGSGWNFLAASALTWRMPRVKGALTGA